MKKPLSCALENYRDALREYNTIAPYKCRVSCAGCQIADLCDVLVPRLSRARRDVWERLGHRAVSDVDLSTEDG